MARRRPPVIVIPAPTERLTWHPALAATRCIEVWVPDRDDLDDEMRAIKCWTRWRNARRAWSDLTRRIWADHRELLPWWARGSGGTPWSFEYLLQKDPGRLAALLARRDLPADWVPTPAPRALMELTNYGALPPGAADLLTGE